MLARTFLAASSLFLFAAPVTGSSGLRGACIIVCSLSLLWLLKRGEARVPGPFPRALLVLMIAWALLALASWFWSADPKHTGEELKVEIVYAGAVFAIFYLGAGERTRWRRWWSTILVGAVLLVIAESGRDLVSDAPRQWHGGVGAFSTHLALIAPLLLALRWHPPWGLRMSTLPFAVALGFLFIAAWDTQNRIVWLAFLAAFVVAAFARRWSALPQPEWGLKQRGVVALIAVLIVALFATVSAQRGRVDRPKDPSVGAALLADLRPRLWSTGWEHFQRAPVLGHGFGRQIADEVFEPLTPPHGHPQVFHAHNVFMNVAIQLGGVGLAIFIAMLLLLAYEFRRALRVEATAPAAILGLAVLSAFVVKNFTDDFMYRHNALVFWALMGMLLGFSRPRTSSPRPSGAAAPPTGTPAPSA